LPFSGKEERSLKKNRLMFTNKKHPAVAYISTILGAISVMSLIYAAFSSFTRQGAVTGRYGFGIALAMLYSLAGLVLALIGLRKEDVLRTFSVIGAVLNVLALLMCGFLLWIPT
jgi:hypothetical protein